MKQANATENNRAESLGQRNYIAVPSAKDLEVVRSLGVGETYAHIGRRLGVSRQRIHQIAIRNGVHRQQMLRWKKAQEFIAPYLPLIGPGRKCQICLGPNAQLTRSRCSKCEKAICAILRIKARLKKFRKSGDRLALANAICDIRKFGIRPEDLRLA